MTRLKNRNWLDASTPHTLVSIILAIVWAWALSGCSVNLSHAEELTTPTASPSLRATATASPTTTTTRTPRPAETPSDRLHSPAVFMPMMSNIISPTATIITASPTETLTAPPTAAEAPTATPTSTETPLPTATATAVQPTPDGTTRVLRVPILMYHYLSTPPPGADEVRLDLSIPPELFERHLCALRDAGYTGITLQDLTLALQTGAPLPPKPIILTFDDGYCDAYSGAFPLLRKYGFPATFFLITRFIDEGRPDYLTWDQAAEMRASGMDMQAHGYSHPDLRERETDYLMHQILGAKQAIEAHLHNAVRFFAYPSGKYDAAVIEVLRATGYWAAVTVESGVEQCSDRPFELQRIRVRPSYDAARLLDTIAAKMNAPADP